MKKLVLVILISVFFIVACTQQKIASGINPVEQSELEGTTSILLFDLYVEGGHEDPILVLDKPEDIDKIVRSLDSQHEITNKTFCAPHYRLQLQKKDGTTVEIDYFCDSIDPFIRSELDYFKNEDYAASTEFVEVVDEFIAQNDITNGSFSESEEGPPSELANPASVFCEEQGGTVDMRKDASGGMFGVCVFDDGSECEEWEFFRGECKPGD
jgi:putative hemolysin